MIAGTRVEVDAMDLSILMVAALRYVSLSQGYCPPATDRWADEIAARDGAAPLLSVAAD